MCQFLFCGTKKVSRIFYWVQKKSLNFLSFLRFIFLFPVMFLYHSFNRWWSGSAKVSCILRHRGVELILAYSWAKPAILIAGKGRGGMFFMSSNSSLSFLFLFLPCSSLSSLLLSLLSLLSLPVGDDKMTHKG